MRPPRESGLAGTAQPGPRLAAWAARRPPTRRHPRRRPARERAAGELGLLRAARGAGCARRRPGARGRPRCPSPRPGAEQREAAQAAAGPAAARRPREAAERAPEGVSLGLDGRRRSGVAPRLLTGGEESRNPGDPGRTAEMPQTDTTAILETVSSGRGEGRRSGGTAAGGGEATRGKGCLREGAGTAGEGGEGKPEGERAPEGGGRGAGGAGPSAGKGRRAGRGRREEPAGRVTWGRYKRPKLKREEDLAGLAAKHSGLLLAFLTRLGRTENSGEKVVHPHCTAGETEGRGGGGAVSGWDGNPVARRNLNPGRRLCLQLAGPPCPLAQ